MKWFSALTGAVRRNTVRGEIQCMEWHNAEIGTVSGRIQRVERNSALSGTVRGVIQ